MSACSMLSYNNVTPAAWQCGVQWAAQHGVTINTNQGQVTVSGFTVAWNYNPQAGTCSIQCTDSPTLVPCFAINSFIENVVQACLNQYGVVMTAMV